MAEVLNTLDPDLGVVIAKVIRKFPDNFSHIDPRHIAPILVTGTEHPKAYAEVKKIPLYVRPVTLRYKLALLVYGELFYGVSPNVQRLIIVHELEHIQPHFKYEGEYTLKDHEVQEWALFVGLLGSRWVERGAQFNILDAEYPDWQTALGSMTAEQKVRRKSK